MTRRDLFPMAAGSLLAAQSAAAPKTIGDIKPSLYTITYLGFWYRGDALTMDQIVQRCKQFGYEGLEIEGKRPHGAPIDWPTKRCKEFRKQAADSGIAITGVAANNDFSSPIAEHREANLANVREMIRMTSELGGKILRVYLIWAGATKLPDGGGRYDLAQKIWDFTQQSSTPELTWENCRACLIESARVAGGYGVTLALQNHKPIIKSYKDVLRMVGEVGSPHLKCCMDAPIMESKDPEYLRKVVLETGPLQIHTHFGGEYEQDAPGQPIRRPKVQGQWGGPYKHEGYETADIYVPFFRAMLETGYRGYAGYELCHPLPVVNGKTVGLDFADKNARLAAEYIRGAIAEAKKQATGALARL